MSRHDDEFPEDLSDITERMRASRPQPGPEALDRIHRRATAAASTRRKGSPMSRRRFAVGFTTLTAMLGVTGAGVLTTQGVAFSELPVISALGLGDAKVETAKVTGTVKRAPTADAPKKLTGAFSTPTRKAGPIRKAAGSKKNATYKRLFTFRQGDPAIGCGYIFTSPPPASTPVSLTINLSNITNPACLQYFISTFFFTPNP